MKYIYLLLLCAVSQFNFAQVGIGTTLPNGLLDLTSATPSAPVTTDGLLIPRVLAFPSPVGIAQNGMLVFLTTEFAGNKVGIYYYDFPTMTWKWMTTGNNANIWAYNNSNTRIELPFQSDGATTRATGNEIYILDNGNTGFGKTPAYKFHVRGDIAAEDGLNTKSITTAASGSTVFTDNIEPWTDNGVRIYDGNTLSHLHIEGRGVGIIQAYGTTSAAKNALENANTSDLILQNSGGKVGIGNNLSPAAILDVIGDMTLSTGYYYGGKSSPANVEISRSLATAVNSTVEIGNFTNTTGAHSFRLTATANNFSVTKSYIVSCKLNQTAGVWQLLQPTTTTGATATDDFEVDINVNASVATLRLRKSLGVVGGIVSFRVENTGTITDVFGNISATAIGVTVPTAAFGTAFWATTGNATTVDGTNFIGTTDAIPLNFRVSNSKSGRISSSGETFFGFEAGKNNSNSANDRNNSAFGYRAFANNSSTAARDNTAIGQSALELNNGGNGNTALGTEALKNNLGASSNTAIGKQTLTSNTASFNTALGWESMISNTTGTRNLGLGVRAQRFYTVSNDNIAIGYETMVGVLNSVAATAINNVAIGNNAMNANVSGLENSAFGNDALKVNTTGSFNLALGHQSLFGNTTGANNTALGRKALSKNITGADNTAIGYNALLNSNADNNTAIGRNASFTNTTGNSNTSVGYNSMFTNLTGSNNTSLGFNSMYTNSTGANNIAIGYNSMFLNSAGSGNTIIGSGACYNIVGANNTAIGNLAGNSLTTGSNNILIGANTDFATATVSDQMNIGNGIYGLTMTSTAAAKIGIGTTNPLSRFQVGLDNGNNGGMVQVNLSNADSQIQGIKVSVSRTAAGPNFAINGTANGIGATTNYGLYGWASGATDKNWGLFVDTGDAFIRGSVGVGTLTPNASAVMDLESTTKGLLIPRMTKVQRDAITKVAGLMIFQTDNTPGLRVCNGTNWVRFTETID